MNRAKQSLKSTFGTYGMLAYFAGLIIGNLTDRPLLMIVGFAAWVGVNVWAFARVGQLADAIEAGQP